MAPFLFDIPSTWATRVATGEVQRRGTDLIWSGSKRFAAHLQETGQLSKLVSSSGNPVTAVVTAASSLGANIQLEQVKSMLGTVQLLSGATLVSSLVGIGVSVAGFVMISRRLGKMADTLRDIGEQTLDIKNATTRIETRQEAHDISQVQALLGRAEEAWLRQDSEAIWKEIDLHIDQAQRYWRLRVAGASTPGIFLDTSFSLEEAVAAQQAALQLAAARTQILLLLGELSAAIQYGDDLAKWHDAATRGLNPVKIASARVTRVARERKIHQDDARTIETSRARRVIAALRDSDTALQQRKRVLRTIERRELSPQEYVQQLREYDEGPLLVLKAS
ncbi:MAG: hypothetical protein KAI47_01880 [Deltaproteobacteria bacterium]|nr:hypothetical protein [Deltaproteobacteria bacterium]